MTADHRIEIIIDHLVVHGMKRRQGRAIGHDLQTRLEELARGWLDGSAALPPTGRLHRTAPVTIATGPADPQFGRDVADAAFTRITSSRQPTARTSTDRGARS